MRAPVESCGKLNVSFQIFICQRNLAGESVLEVLARGEDVGHETGRSEQIGIEK